MIEAACRNPLGAITSCRTAIRLCSSPGATETISTPARPGKCPRLRRLNASAVNSGRKPGVLLVISAQGKLAVHRALCQAQRLLETRHHASVFLQAGLTGEKKGRQAKMSASVTIPIAGFKDLYDVADVEKALHE